MSTTALYRLGFMLALVAFMAAAIGGHIDTAVYMAAGALGFAGLAMREGRA